MKSKVLSLLDVDTAPAECVLTKVCGLSMEWLCFKLCCLSLATLFACKAEREFSLAQCNGSHWIAFVVDQYYTVSINNCKHARMSRNGCVHANMLCSDQPIPWQWFNLNSSSVVPVFHRYFFVTAGNVCYC